MKYYDSIMFDLDGTMWDSTEVAAVVWSEIAVKYGIKDKVTSERLKTLYGLPLEEIAIQLFPSVSIQEAVKVMEECVVEQCPVLCKSGGTLLGQIEKTLKELKKEYPLFIISNCRSGYIETFLAAHKLDSYFTDFECPGGSKKLKADNIKLVMERNQLKHPVYVGDTLGDGMAAREAGVPFVYARYGFGKTSDYDFVIDSFEELIPLFIK